MKTTELKHTKGEWTSLTSKNEISIIANSTEICHVNTGTCINPFEGIANAKLMAAAPELLEASLEIIRVYNESCLVIEREKAHNNLQQAIKKATE